MVFIFLITLFFFIVTWKGFYSLYSWLKVNGNLKNIIIYTNLPETQYAKLKDIIRVNIKKDDIIFLDINYLKETIEENFWVANIVIKREWPNTINIYLEVYTKIANFINIGRVNVYGELFFEEISITDKNRVMFYGKLEEVGEILSYYQLINNYVQHIKSPILWIRKDYLKNWSVGLQNGLEIRMGREDLLERVKTFMDNYIKLKNKKDNNVKYVDLRYDEGFALKWLE